MSSLIDLFSTSGFLPHGYCLVWDPALVTMHVSADVLIALAYFSIPIAIQHFLSRKVDIEYRWVGYLFSGFILWCGITHVVGTATLWYPYYGLEGIVKAITAVVSVVTAALVWVVMPKALALPTPAALRALNRQLEGEITVRRDTEAHLRNARDELELRVQERTAALSDANAKLSVEVAARAKAQSDLSQYARLLESRNAELNAFAYSASHDLKEPLRGIANYAQFLVEDYGDVLPEDGQRRTDDIKAMAVRLQGMIENLHEFARIGMEDRTGETIDMIERVNSVTTTLSSFLGENNATVSVSPDLPNVVGNGPRLEQLIRNLVTNAVKFNSNDDRRVDITWAPDVSALPADAMPMPEMPAAGPVFMVRDNGIGIPQENLDEVFGVFRRLHLAEEYGTGSGIGLSIAKRIVEWHGGSIWARNNDEGGTTFYFTLKWSNNDK